MIGTPLPHWCRIVMNSATNEFVANLVPNRLDALEISGTAWRDAGFRSYEHVAYPGFDICRDRTTRTYDIIIAEQVFEHIRRPDRAARNVHAMLRRHGVFVITAPFLIKYHPEPLDLWRWTAEGLNALLEDAGFSTVAAHSWGSRACVAGNFDTWPDYMPELHSLENEPEFPIVVWAFARRDAPQTPLDRLIAYGKAIRRRMAHRPDRHIV
ncbi:MAG TPA: methyltransferase domain-containing protein [Acetobacteraceae bacterium]|nr:methyltransferase domain-containing protein [Acetobacteraceae bacterium]